MDGINYPVRSDSSLTWSSFDSRSMGSQTIEGKFVRFGEPYKYIELETINGELLTLKLPKHERLRAVQLFKPGISLRCILKPKQDDKNSLPKLERVEIIGESGLNYQPQNVQTITLKVCQHKACAKKGALEICQSLSAAIAPELTTQVLIQPVGCLKHCKQAPNLVVSSTQVRHSSFKIAEIPELLNSLGLDHAVVSKKA